MGLWLKVPCRGLARATSSSRTACQNSVVLPELWGLTWPDFGGTFVNLEGVRSYSLLTVSSCGVGNTADYCRNHAKGSKSRFSASPRQHLVLVIPGSD